MAGNATNTTHQVVAIADQEVHQKCHLTMNLIVSSLEGIFCDFIDRIIACVNQSLVEPMILNQVLKRCVGANQNMVLGKPEFLRQLTSWQLSDAWKGSRVLVVRKIGDILIVEMGDSSCRCYQKKFGGAYVHVHEFMCQSREKHSLSSPRHVFRLWHWFRCLRQYQIQEVVFGRRSTFKCAVVTCIDWWSSPLSIWADEQRSMSDVHCTLTGFIHVQLADSTAWCTVCNPNHYLGWNGWNWLADHVAKNHTSLLSSGAAEFYLVN